jgi:pimeloyl-ACP methyl ester carboxylesterase
VYLEGGPGGHALAGLEFSFDDRFAPFLAQRDLIVFDQRGVGFSTPTLACPEIRDLDIDLLDDVLEPEEYTIREIVALQDCRGRLISEGVDLTQYNSRTNAADVADLRVALGLTEWNLYGISYGTRLALTAMRDNPEGIRSVILDSTVPPQADLVSSIPASADRAFDQFFAACGASPACQATFPNLEAGFFALQASLDAQPAQIEITDFLSGDSYPGVLTGDDVIGLMFQSLYSEQLIPILPDVITDARNGDLSGFEQLASLFFTNDRFISVGMYLAVQCNEEYPFSSVAALEGAVAAHPEVAALFGDIPGEFEECAVWGAGTADEIEDDPVVSDIRTLVLGGVFDPITPPEYGIQAAATLSNSFFFEFPGLGHGVSTAHPCPLAMSLGFLDNPSIAPDAACIADMDAPQFLTPGRLSVNLIPFEEELFDLTVTGLVPEGWDSAGFGQYTAPGLGDTAIVQQARLSGPGLTIESMAAGIGDFFDIPVWSESTYAGSRTWDLFEGTDGELMYLMGLAESGDFLLTVILAAPPDIFDEYRTLAFTPALDAIEATG